eukprot:CAMPEP_0118905762 /NCGR_PEP_ID=MMETSP1166-20130328/9610_1 /TAXON_ID=1104430 /ORGANISM="Chrysoreinhardia sp, Strain CCMP3193" /LENGTH=174 /DNA_ID=CAMNT_0006845033 /DNA_START=12 /DNA_END=536 /DNA_ORIENTATION=+
MAAQRADLGHGAEAQRRRGAVESTEEALLREHEFVRDEGADDGASWEGRLAARYYNKLYKEYAIIDLSRRGGIGLRWRTEREVARGIGVDVCAERSCDLRQSLRSFEVPFAYEEKGRRKRELVKVKLCPACARKLHSTSEATNDTHGHRRSKKKAQKKHHHNTKNKKKHREKAD